MRARKSASESAEPTPKRLISKGSNDSVLFAASRDENAMR